jgi:hypothetical protein
MTSPTTIAFLCGDDMNPSTIRTRPGFADARFTGIGSIAASDLPEFPTTRDRIWGILIEGVSPQTGQSIEIQQRDGTRIHGEVTTTTTDWSDLDRLVSEARYWELPVAWWQSLKPA